MYGVFCFSTLNWHALVTLILRWQTPSYAQLIKASPMMVACEMAKLQVVMAFKLPTQP